MSQVSLSEGKSWPEKYIYFSTRYFKVGSLFFPAVRLCSTHFSRGAGLTAGSTCQPRGASHQVASPPVWVLNASTAFPSLENTGLSEHRHLWWCLLIIWDQNKAWKLKWAEKVLPLGELHLSVHCFPMQWTQASANSPSSTLSCNLASLQTQ